MVLPLEPLLQVQRRQAAHRGALLAVLVAAGRQRDLAAQVGGLHLQPGQLVVLRQRPVHVVGEDQVGLAGLDARRQDADPQARARRSRAPTAPSLGERSGHASSASTARMNASGTSMPWCRFSALRLDRRRWGGGSRRTPRSPDARRQVDRRRAAPQRALADRQRQAVHHADERDDAGGLADRARPSRRSSAGCPSSVPMPPPLDASQTFSFQRPTMPSRLSEASFRKQEIGRPRCVPPLDSTGVAGMNHSLLM